MKEEKQQREAEREKARRADVVHWRDEQGWQARVDREQDRKHAMEREKKQHDEAVKAGTAIFTLFGGCKCQGCSERRKRERWEKENPEKDLGADNMEFLQWKLDQAKLKRMKVEVDVVGGHDEEISLIELVKREKVYKKEA
jgi:hypothetical protein